MDSLSARTASQADDAASSEFTSSVAALCCSAWKEPTGLPNCSRVRMYSIAASAQRRTVPAAAHAARATTMQRARSVEMPDISALSGTTWSARCSTPTSVHRSVPCCGSIVTPGLGVTTNHRWLPSSVRAGSRMCCAAQTPNTEPDDPLSRQEFPSATACTSQCSGSTTTAVAPAARSVSSGLADESARLATALAVTVLNSGPGSNAAAAASTTQAMSARPPSCPPTCPGRCTA